MKALKVRHILAQGKRFLSVALGFEEDIDQAQLDRRLKNRGSMRRISCIVFNNTLQQNLDFKYTKQYI